MLCRNKSSFGQKGLSYTNIVKKYRTYSLSRFQDFFGGGSTSEAKSCRCSKAELCEQNKPFLQPGIRAGSFMVFNSQKYILNILETVSLSFLTFGWVLKVIVLQSVWNIFMSFHIYFKSSLKKSCLFIM